MALEKFMTKQQKELEPDEGPRRKNARPEMDLVQKPCKAWFRRSGWSMFIIDAKAEWNAAAGTFISSSQVEPGFSDSVGCTPDGTAAFVEFKAPGKRATLKPHQRAFLEDKIRKGCFAICVDSVEGLADAWERFKGSRAIERQLGINFLLRHLPLEPSQRRPRPDADELPF